MALLPDPQEKIIDHAATTPADIKNVREVIVPVDANSVVVQKKFPFGLRIIESYLRNTSNPYITDD